MFTGIIEDLGKIIRVETEKSNLHLYVKSKFTSELKVDQSVSHNGVCLTVVDIQDDIYKVTAIAETLAKTNLGNLQVNEIVNLERGMLLNTRLDGHIVQGHVDQTGVCTNVEDENGSTRFTFSYDAKSRNVTIEKGSITINGVSLTVVDSFENQFSVVIIPYTMEHTNFKNIKVRSIVNLEFDVIGKYVSKLMSVR
ncbi:riboflavin synthase [Capnocytophaga cynodegmi]|uniref:Riboflavin synthase n=1 Tax=Capnocytophaga cynodegmi TaxID=28189 RepID=A0A0B7H8R1_9FLAO|nr:riboflavin synthase [Capnocytophaga cynodegmi]CEN34332.1 Riboflavin synthase [Capnocytophaga cynodegmi]